MGVADNTRRWEPCPFSRRDPAPSPAQSGPLAHPEAMLFVHNGQGEALNSQTLFQERVRAHQQISRPRRNRRKHPTPRLCLQPGVQHRNPQARLVAPASQGAPVLLGQHFGGCHEQALAAGPRNEQGGSKGHHGLAAAHVTLQQSLHGRRAGQIRKHGPDGAFLGRRGRKGQRGSRRREHRLAIDSTAPARGLAGAGPFQGQPDLHHEQILEGETLLRRGLPTKSSAVSRRRARPQVDGPGVVTRRSRESRNPGPRAQAVRRAPVLPPARPPRPRVFRRPGQEPSPPPGSAAAAPGPTDCSMPPSRPAAP